MFSYFTFAGTPYATFLVNPAPVSVTESSTASDLEACSALVDVIEASTSAATTFSALAALAAISESLSAFDSESSATSANVSISEASSATQVSSSLMSAAAAVLEVLNATSFESVLASMDAAVSEAVSAASTSSASYDALASISETSSANDSSDTTMSATSSQTEDSFATDLTESFMSAVGSVLDVMLATEVVTAFAAVPAYITEESIPHRQMLRLLGSSSFGEMAFSDWLNVTVDNDTQSASYVASPSITEVSNAEDLVDSFMIAVAQVIETMSAQDVEYLLKHPIDPLYITEANERCYTALRAVLEATVYARCGNPSLIQ